MTLNNEKFYQLTFSLHFSPDLYFAIIKMTIFDAHLPIPLKDDKLIEVFPCTSTVKGVFKKSSSRL
jgi:hypothetical protein